MTRTRNSSKSTKNTPATAIPASVVKDSRRLTADDKEELMQFLKAQIIHRKRHNSPTDYHDLVAIQSYLRNGFESVLKAFLDASHNNSAIRLDDIPAKNEAERQWHKLCYSLISSGMTSWQNLRNGVDHVLKQMNATSTNRVMDELLVEGNTRRTIQKHMDLEEILDLFGRARKENLTNEQKLDIIMQANDANSTLFQHILTKWPYSSYGIQHLLWLYRDLQADVVDNHGNVKVMRADPNQQGVTQNQSEHANVLMLAIMALVHFRTQGVKTNVDNIFELIRYLIEDRNADITLPCTWLAGTSKGTCHTPLGYAFIYATHPHVKEMVWDIIKMILKRKPMRELYLTNDKGYQNVYGYSVKNGKTHIVDNVFVAESLSGEKLEWLLEHGGMDPRATSYGRYSVKGYIEKMIRDSQKRLNVIEQKLPPKKELEQKLSDELNALKHQITSLETELTDTSGMIEEYKSTSEKLNAVFDRFNMYDGGGRKHKK